MSTLVVRDRIENFWVWDSGRMMVWYQDLEKYRIGRRETEKDNPRRKSLPSSMYVVPT